MVYFDVQSPTKTPREMVEYKKRPFVKELLNSFNDYNAIVKSRVWKFTILTDFQPGDNEGGLAWTKGNQIYIAMDKTIPGSSIKIDTTHDPVAHPDELNFARFLMMHEIIHNLYAPESVIQNFASQRMISDGKASQVYPDALIRTDKWNHFGETWRSLGDILVNGHIAETPVPPKWGVSQKEIMTIGIEKTWDITLGRPNTRQKIHEKFSSKPSMSRFLEWNDYFLNGRQNPPETGRVKECLDAFVSFTGSTTTNIDKFYVDFYELVSVW